MARLFFAIWPPPATAAALHDWALQAQRATGGRAIATPAIHLTLAFLGDVPPSRLPAARAAAGRLRVPAFALRLSEVRHRPQRGLIWAAPAVIPEPLTGIAHALAAALHQEGFTLERRAFLVHVTLLRRAHGRALLPAFVPIDWPVAEFTLVRSILDSDAARYSVEARFALAD